MERIIMNHKIEQFIKDYVKLCKKHDCTFASWDVHEDNLWIQLHPNETTMDEFLSIASKIRNPHA